MWLTVGLLVCCGLLTLARVYGCNDCLPAWGLLAWGENTLFETRRIWEYTCTFATMLLYAVVAPLLLSFAHVLHCCCTHAVVVLHSRCTCVAHVLHCCCTPEALTSHSRCIHVAFMLHSLHTHVAFCVPPPSDYHRHQQHKQHNNTTTPTTQTTNRRTLGQCCASVSTRVLIATPPARGGGQLC